MPPIDDLGDAWNHQVRFDEKKDFSVAAEALP